MKKKSQIVPDSSGTEVIVNNSAPKQNSGRKNHFITWFYTTIEEIVPVLEKAKKLCKKGTYQTEKCPSTGRPHIHMMLWGYEKFRDTELKIPKRDGVNTYRAEPLKDYTNESNYANKEDESYDGLMRGCWGFPPPRKPLKLINPTKEWQQEILKIMDEEPSMRKVYWYWSEQGRIGKSQFAKYCIATRSCAFIDEGKKADIMHTIIEADMDVCNCVIFEVPRENGNKVSYKSIESIKNGMVYSSKYDSNWKLFNSPHLFVFANEPPQYEKLSADRWVVKNIDEYGGLDEEDKYDDFILFNWKNDIKVNSK